MKKILITVFLLFVSLFGFTEEIAEEITVAELIDKADKGDLDSQSLIGFMYFFGQEVEQDYIKARHYYELAAKQGDEEALLNLGFIYFNGYGVNQDYYKAKEYYELVAKNGNAEALMHIGLLYSEGLGVTQDHKKAQEYLRLSCDKDFEMACKIYKRFKETGY